MGHQQSMVSSETAQANLKPPHMPDRMWENPSTD